jgi:hypothetical protein
MNDKIWNKERGRASYEKRKRYRKRDLKSLRDGKRLWKRESKKERKGNKVEKARKKQRDRKLEPKRENETQCESEMRWMDEIKAFNYERESDWKLNWNDASDNFSCTVKMQRSISYFAWSGIGWANCTFNMVHSDIKWDNTWYCLHLDITNELFSSKSSLFSFHSVQHEDKIRNKTFNKEVLLRGKTQYSRPPYTNYVRSASFCIKDITYVFYITNYLNKEVNCSEPSSSVSIPCFQ